jgi:hypothetical protein
LSRRCSGIVGLGLGVGSHRRFADQVRLPAVVVVGCAGLDGAEREGSQRTGSQRTGSQRKGGESVPGLPAAELVLVEVDPSVRGLEAFFDSSADSGYPHR